MQKQLFTPILNDAKCFCAIRCTERTRVSPNTRILPAQRTSILLKTHGPQSESLSTNQVVGGSTPLRPATFAGIHTQIKPAHSFAVASLRSDQCCDSRRAAVIATPMRIITAIARLSQEAGIGVSGPGCFLGGTGGSSTPTPVIFRVARRRAKQMPELRVRTRGR